MELQAGSRLGPYEIVGIIGAGGMGKVYRARDTRLGRDVAVKVLPAAVAQDEERRARFLREAQAIAALSHPNILAVFDTGLSETVPGATGSVLYVVTELLEGETLGGRLATGGPMPVRKAIEITIQIARGLAAAHAKGIVHRDLKPDNVFLLADGQVKILDFGLAKFAEPGPESLEAATAETRAAMTDPGLVMGTIGYMAPEQVRGQAVDARADLFALGTILYEMVAGKRAFSGGTAADTMTAILREDPPELTGSRPDISPALDRIVRHCLEKNPAERFQTARDVAFALEALSGSATGASTAVPAITEAASGRATRRWLSAVAGLLLLAAGVSVGWLMRPGAARVSFDLKTFDRLRLYNARYMPDGLGVIYSAALEGSVPSLFVLRPDTNAPQPLAEGDMHLLSVSSKGELAVLTNPQPLAHRLFTGTLARLTPGGAPREWLTDVREADWAPDGESIAVVRDMGDGTDRLEFPDGTVLHEMRGYLSDPRVSHDGTRVAFVEHTFRWDDRGVVRVVDRATLTLTTLTPELWGIEGLAWTADDQTVLYAGTDPDQASSVNRETYRVPARGGAPERMFSTMSAVVVHDTNADGGILLSREDDRTEVFVKRPGDLQEARLSWLDLATPVQLSQDGELLVFTDQNIKAGHEYAVMIRRTDGSPPARLGEGSAQRFGLSPDGKWVVARLPEDLEYVAYPTGPGSRQTIATDNGQFAFTSWYPDSANVMMCGGPNPADRRCYKQKLGGAAREAVGPEGIRTGLVTPDGTEAFILADGSPVLWVDGEIVRPKLRQNFGTFASWAGAKGAFFYRSIGPGERELAFIDLSTGAEMLLSRITVPDLAGLSSISINSVVGNGSRYGYVYSYNRYLSALVEATMR